MINSSFQNVDVNPDAAARNLMQRAHNQDGVPEILVGAFFLAVAGLMWLQVAFKPGSIEYLASVLGLMLLIIPVGALLPWMIRMVRRRYLIERVGYVEPKPANRKRLAVVVGIAFVVGAAAAFAAWRGAFPPASWVLAGTGIFGGAIVAAAGRLPRFIVGGVIGAVVGCVAGLDRLTLALGFTLVYGVMGLLSLGSGVVVLLLFMRKRDEAGE
ncbi:MAG: hypothetical protein WCA10_13475 [Terracidiphilus sp.]